MLQLAELNYQNKQLKRLLSYVNSKQGKVPIAGLFQIKLVHPETKILLTITHPHIVRNTKDVS